MLAGKGLITSNKKTASFEAAAGTLLPTEPTVMNPYYNQ